VVYSLFSIPPKNLGDPGSSRGTLEHIRVGLTGSGCDSDGFESYMNYL
jgi:hypothetical protein